MTRIREWLMLVAVGGAVAAGAWQQGMLAHYVTSHFDATIPRPADFEPLASEVRPHARLVMLTAGHPRSGSERHFSAQYTFTPTAVLAMDAPSVEFLLDENLLLLLEDPAPGVRRVRGVFEALGAGAPALVDVVDSSHREALVKLVMESEAAHGHRRNRQDFGSLVLLEREAP
jgi:hypothetical protein